MSPEMRVVAESAPPEGASTESTLGWFEYVALRSDGSRVEGRDMASSEHELDRTLEARGLVLLEATPSSRGSTRRTGRLSRPELMRFTNQVSTLLGAGIPIVNALREIRARTRSRATRERVDEILADLEGGLSLSEAIGRQERAFPPVYRATVVAGERSTHLPEILGEQAAYLEWVAQIRTMTFQALVYPTMLILAVAGLVVILVTFLVPRLTRLYPGGAEDLPRETRILLAVSDAAAANAYWIGGLVLLAAAGVVAGARVPAARRFGSRLLLRVPRVGEVLGMIATSRFAKTVSILHEAGCEVVETLTMASRSCGNAYLEGAFDRATERVRRGMPIAESLERERGVDPFLVQFVGVGETSGDLAGSLKKLANVYDAEVPRTVRWALSLIEPAIVVVGGTLVLGILLATLMPIVTLYEKL